MNANEMHLLKQIDSKAFFSSSVPDNKKKKTLSFEHCIHVPMMCDFNIAICFLFWSQMIQLWSFGFMQLWNKSR